MNIKPAQEMTEAEIRENIIESTKWETKIEEISRVKEIIEDELVSVHVDPELKENYDNSFLEALDIGETKFRALNLEDKKFGIFTNAPSKVKGNIVYPDPFHGRPGDNVYKFTKLFKEALDADQVRTRDQVKTLLKYLKGEAKVAVGEHVDNLDDALDNLTKAFGNPKLIWQKVKESFERKLGNIRNWGKEASFDAINWCVEFLKHAKTLAIEYQVLKSAIYGGNTVQVREFTST